MNTKSLTSLLALHNLDASLSEAALALNGFSMGLQNCYAGGESTVPSFISLRNDVLKDASAFSCIVTPVSITVMKQLCTLTTMLKSCTTAQKFHKVARVL